MAWAHQLKAKVDIHPDWQSAVYHTHFKCNDISRLNVKDRKQSVQTLNKRKSECLC